jgi:hypothetical protein
MRRGRFASSPPGGAARGQAKRLENSRHLQRDRLHVHPWGRGCHLHARGAGDRGGFHQGTCQLTALFILAMYLGQANGRLEESTSALPGAGTDEHSRQARNRTVPEPALRKGGRVLHRSTDLLYLGRGGHFPIALEGTGIGSARRLGAYPSRAIQPARRERERRGDGGAQPASSFSGRRRLSACVGRVDPVG